MEKKDLERLIVSPIVGALYGTMMVLGSNKMYNSGYDSLDGLKFGVAYATLNFALFSTIDYIKSVRKRKDK